MCKLGDNRPKYCWRDLLYFGLIKKRRHKKPNVDLNNYFTATKRACDCFLVHLFTVPKGGPTPAGTIHSSPPAVPLFMSAHPPNPPLILFRVYVRRVNFEATRSWLFGGCSSYRTWTRVHKSVYTNRGHNWSDTLDERKYICSVMHTKAQHANTGVRANKYLHACVDMPMHSAHKDKATDYYTVFKVSRMGIMGVLGGGVPILNHCSHLCFSSWTKEQLWSD